MAAAARSRFPARSSCSNGAGDPWRLPDADPCRCSRRGRTMRGSAVKTYAVSTNQGESPSTIPSTSPHRIPATSLSARTAKPRTFGGGGGGRPRVGRGAAGDHQSLTWGSQSLPCRGQDRGDERRVRSWLDSPVGQARATAARPGSAMESSASAQGRAVEPAGMCSKIRPPHRPLSGSQQVTNTPARGRSHWGVPRGHG
jgi:hypothetical protein